MSAPLPRVVLHTAVSLDGRLDGFTPDVGLFYEVVGLWKEDATLAGSETIVRADAGPDLAEVPAPAPPGDPRPLLVVPDSRGRVHTWNKLRAAGYWRDALAWCSEITPRTHLDELRRKRVPFAIAGVGPVDLRAGLTALARDHGVRTVRVDSGGTLNGVLLRLGLVSEVSLLVHPVLVGGTSPRTWYRAPDPMNGPLVGQPLAVERLRGDVLWLRYALAPRA
jgi:2,5-diamino-6-(ribosylamino)-4(3H)-pyrimidinone 5'-phosphate reductase